MEKFRFIDSHVHLFPEPLASSNLKWFDERAWILKHRVPADEVIRLLTELGAEKLVIYNHSHKADISSYINEWNYGLTQKYPNLNSICRSSP